MRGRKHHGSHASLIDSGQEHPSKLRPGHHRSRSLAPPSEISQIWRRLVLLQGHQETVRADKVSLLPNEDERVVLRANEFIPDRPGIRIAKIHFVDSPRSGQSIVEDRDLVMQNVWI